jgi:hypothetical protein
MTGGVGIGTAYVDGYEVGTKIDGIITIDGYPGM